LIVDSNVYSQLQACAGSANQAVSKCQQEQVMVVVVLHWASRSALEAVLAVHVQ
jgi:hypothetical protein